MADIQIGQLTASPGQIVKGHLGFVTLADGNKVGVPAVIAHGAESGPVLTVTTSVHGTEINGTGSVLRLINSLDPGKMKGTLIAVTASNPFAFQVGSYFTPFIARSDGKNLSSASVWPPDPEGTLTDRVAAVIAPAVHAATHVIDLHSNPDDAIPFTLINRGLAPNDETREKMEQMAKAFGFTIIESSGGPTGINGGSVANGVPAMTPELTGNMFLRDENTNAGVIGVRNVMKSIGILEGDLEKQPIEPMQGDFVAAGRLTSHKGGLVWVKQPPGKFMKKGDVAIEMMDVWGNIVEEVKMPFDGYCWSYTGGIGGTYVVPEGTPIAYAFRERG